MFFCFISTLMPAGTGCWALLSRLLEPQASQRWTFCNPLTQIQEHQEALARRRRKSQNRKSWETFVWEFAQLLQLVSILTSFTIWNHSIFSSFLPWKFNWICGWNIRNIQILPNKWHLVEFDNLEWVSAISSFSYTIFFFFYFYHWCLQSD